MSLWGYQNMYFLVALCHLIAERPNLGAAIKKFFHQMLQIWGQLRTTGKMSLQLLPVVQIFPRSISVICHGRWYMNTGKKYCLKDKCLSSWLSTFTKWLYYEKNSVTLKYKTLQSSALIILKVFKFLVANISWNQTLRYFCLNWEKHKRLDWFYQFLCEGYLPLIRKDSVTHIHGFAEYMKGGLPFAFNWFYFIQYLISFTSVTHLPLLCVQCLV